MITPRELETAGFPGACAQYAGAPERCPHPVSEVPGDGIRCAGCKCHPDLCACGTGLLSMIADLVVR